MAKAELSLLQSILAMKCPRCRTGNLFTVPGSFVYKDLTVMPKTCPSCSQNYMPEPGFYYGAMFVSYGICGIWFLGFIAMCMFGFNLSVDTSFILLFVMIAIFFGWIFRISRSIWIHINVKYDPSKLEKG